MDNQYQFNNMSPENTPVEENEENSSSSTKQKVLQTSMNIFAVIGIISLLSLGALGTMKLANITPQSLVAAVSNFTSIFVPANEKPITFNLETYNVDVEEPFTLAWTHQTRLSGTYLFQYDCRENVSVEAKDSDGILKEVTCDTPFSFKNENNTASLIFYSTQGRFTDIPINLTFIPEDSSKATQQGSALLTIVNKNISDEGSPVSVGGTVSRGAETKETHLIGGNRGTSDTTDINVSNPARIPDLKVTVLATGVVDKTTNDFTPSVAVGENDRAAIRFEVRNVGTKSSGIWSFIIDLPISSGTYVFRSDSNQRSLNPGERIEYTLGFDSINRTNDTIEAIINIDTERRVAETNRENNTASAVIEIAQ